MANGWSPERRAHQSKLIRQWRPCGDTTSLPGLRTQAR